MRNLFFSTSISVTQHCSTRAPTSHATRGTRGRPMRKRGPSPTSVQWRYAGTLVRPTSTKAPKSVTFMTRASRNSMPSVRLATSSVPVVLVDSRGTALSESNLLSGSTALTQHLNSWPCRTTSAASGTNAVFDRSLTWTNPSISVPIDTNAPRALTERTIPSNQSPSASSVRLRATGRYAGRRRADRRIACCASRSARRLSPFLS
mmetsp:Transcript_25646/g.102262  ORF Transcript_25646/g.102262 Transcript_25646/m.102262 type:complete len:205 (+) Transcript_25646:1292-1906(+)